MKAGDRKGLALNAQALNFIRSKLKLLIAPTLNGVGQMAKSLMLISVGGYPEMRRALKGLAKDDIDIVYMVGGGRNEAKESLITNKLAIHLPLSPSSAIQKGRIKGSDWR